MPSFYNDQTTTEIYTLPLHDALPISPGALSPSQPPSARSMARDGWGARPAAPDAGTSAGRGRFQPDRKSTRLNSSHMSISYAVFCLKKKHLINTYQAYHHIYST